MPPLELIAAGSSVLLRVHVEPRVDPADAMLIVDHGDEMQVVAPLRGGSEGALGFLLPSDSLSGGPRLLLTAGGVLEELATDLAGLVA